jgi:hypothetical protein
MSGTILRGDDGSLYFIRDEVLAACKVEGEYLDRVNKMLGSEEQEVEGFSFNLTPTQPTQLQPLGYAEGSLVAGKAAVRQAGDTIMCPW